MATKLNRNDMLVIAEIVKRADRMNVLLNDKISLMIDLKIVHENVGLQLMELLEADDENFIHDIVGIQNNFNRDIKELRNEFLPRYAK